MSCIYNLIFYYFASLKAFCTALRIPFERYVAPETVSTEVDWFEIILSTIVPETLLKYFGVSWLDKICILVIFPLVTVTETLVVPPLYPVPLPMYVPSSWIWGS